MNSLYKQFILIVLLALFCTITHADKLSIVYKGDMAKLTLNNDDIADIFMGRSAKHDLTPIDSQNPEIREAFYQTIVGMSSQQLRAYWAKRVFTGRGRPPKRLNKQQLLEELDSKSNIISYTRYDQVLDNKLVIKNINTGER